MYYICNTELANFIEQSSRENFKGAAPYVNLSQNLMYTSNKDKKTLCRVKFATLIRSDYKNKIVTFNSGATCIQVTEEASPTFPEDTFVSSLLDDALVVNGIKAMSIFDDPEDKLRNSMNQPLGIAVLHNVFYVYQNVVVSLDALESVSFNTDAELVDIATFKSTIEEGSIDYPVRNSLILTRK